MSLKLQSWQSAALFLIILVISAGLWTKSLIYSQHTIFQHPDWQSYNTKLKLLAGGKIGSISRHLLAADRLNSDLLFERQRVISKRSFSTKKITSIVRLKKNAYAELLFNITDQDYWVIRLSRHNRIPSKLIRLKWSGEYLETIPLEFKSHRFGKSSLILEQSGEELLISVDKIKLARHKLELIKSPVGVEVSQTGAEVFEIGLEDINGDGQRLDFSPALSFTKYFIPNLLIMALASLALGLIIMIRKKIFLMSLLKASWLICLAGAFWLTFDYLYYAKIPQHFDFKNFTFTTKTKKTAMLDLEKLRYTFFRKWFEVLGGNNFTLEEMIKRGYFSHPIPDTYYCQQDCELFFGNKIHKVAEKKKDVYRMVIHGGSQSMGSGATDLSISYFSLLHQKFQRYLKSKDKVLESINLSQPAGGISLSIKHIQDSIKKYNPDLIIFSYILYPGEQYALRKVIEFTKKKNIVPVVLIQAINLESARITAHQFGVDKTFKVNEHLEMINKTIPFYVLRASGYFMQKEINRKGQVWWDKSHLTDFGHELMAEWLYQQLINLDLKVKR